MNVAFNIWPQVDSLTVDQLYSDASTMCSKWEFAYVSTQKWTTLHEREDEEGKEELLYLLIQKIEFKTGVRFRQSTVTTGLARQFDNHAA